MPAHEPSHTFQYTIWSFSLASDAIWHQINTDGKFHRRQDQTLKGLDGILCVADDILVYGEGNTRSKAAVDRDRKLCRLLQRS